VLLRSASVAPVIVSAVRSESDRLVRKKDGYKHATRSDQLQSDLAPGRKKLEESWEIHSCYEAGASGYWLHRQLEQMGVKNLVVVPKAMGRGGKKQKTDKRDSGELCDSLDRYLRGQDKALSIVGVPTEDQEQNRALIRYHRQIMADRGRCEARGKGLLCAQGIEVHGRWWQGDGWIEVQHNPRLKDWMKEQLIGWRNKILSTDEEQSALRERIAALAPAILPKGVGAYSAVVLEFEMRGFERFRKSACRIFPAALIRLPSSCMATVTSNGINGRGPPEAGRMPFMPAVSLNQWSGALPKPGALLSS